MRVSAARADPRQVVSDLQATNGKDIWLCGGGEFLAQPYPRKLVNTVEVLLMLVLLGKGIPLASEGRRGFWKYKVPLIPFVQINDKAQLAMSGGSSNGEGAIVIATPK